MSKRKWTVSAHLNPNSRGMVLAYPLQQGEADSELTLENLQRAFKDVEDVDAKDLVATFRVHKLRHPRRTRSTSESMDSIPSAQSLFATLELWEMDFGGEKGEGEGKDVQLVSLNGKLNKKGGKWTFSLRDDGDSSDRHIPYLRVATDGNPDRYALVPLDPTKLGSLKRSGKSAEGKRYEIAFKLVISDPGWQAGPGESSDHNTSGSDVLIPPWWEGYSDGQKRKHRRHRLPLLYTRYVDHSPISDEKAAQAVKNYCLLLGQKIDEYWTTYRGAVDNFNVRVDPEKQEPLPAAPSLWGVLKGAYTVGSLFLPGLRSVGIVIDLIDLARLPDKEVKGDKILGQKDQAKAAYKTLKSTGEATIQFVSDLDAFYAYHSSDPAERTRTTQLAQYIRQVMDKAGQIRNQQLAARDSLQQVLLDGIADKHFKEVQKRQIYDEMTESYDRLKDHSTPNERKLLGTLLVEFMNSHNMGIYTFSAKESDLPDGPHSHVAGVNRFLEDHVYHCLLAYAGGALTTEGAGRRVLHVTEALKQKHLKGLRNFVQFFSREAALRHYANKGLPRAKDIDKGTSHWLRKEDLRFYKRRSHYPSVDWKAGYKYSHFYYEVYDWSETSLADID